MSSLEGLWNTLRRAGAEEVAPLLISHGILSVNQLVLAHEQLRAAGLKSWQYESILAADQPDQQAPPGPPPQRADVPGQVSGKRANFQAALEAALPNQRMRALKALDDDVLARTTTPSNEARVRTYMALCRAWEIAAFPLTPENLRCFAASLKAGQYRSAAIYFHAVVGHQQRVLRTSIDPIVRQCIKDYTRSITRGLGVSQLKDSFNGLLVGNIPTEEETDPFSFQSLAHCRDLALIGLWFMMREIEMANAAASDLSLQGSEVQLLIPLQKTDQKGKFTQRTLSTCSCAYGMRRNDTCSGSKHTQDGMTTEDFLFFPCRMEA